MSNRAYLLNTSLPLSNPEALERACEEGRAQYIEIAEATNRIPMPWLACFGSENLQHFEAQVRTGPHTTELLSLALPCTSVEQARRNLAKNQALAETIVGDSERVRPFWEEAMAGLATLPLPYLTLNPIEVFFLNAPAEEAQVLAHSLAHTPDAIVHIKRMSFFEGLFVDFSGIGH